MPKAGIAVITYRRPDYLSKTLAAIRRHTDVDKYEIVVAVDDPDDKQSVSVCESYGVPYIAGDNRGVVWNKNRGLYYFMSRSDCDPIVMLEDDTYPNRSGWLLEWIEAASVWQHVNFTHPGMMTDAYPPISGNGTPRQPHIHRLVTGQCTAVSRSAMRVGGYLDTQFKGYGHGHVEWTKRHAAHLYTGLVPGFSQPRMLFVSIFGGLTAENAPTFRNEDDVAKNGKLLSAKSNDLLRYVAPWQNDEEKEFLSSEVANVATAASVQLPAPSLRGAKVVLDRITANGRAVKCVGWARLENGDPVDEFRVRFSGLNVESFAVRRCIRKDVAKAFARSALDCGFDVSFAIPDAAPTAGVLQLVAVSQGQSEAILYQKHLDLTRCAPGSTISVLDLDKWQGKNLYFGNLYTDERQFSDGSFLGLSLVPKFARDVLHNAYDAFPIPDQSVSKIQAQDVFEHLEFARIPKILDEIYRVLKPGGVFRLSVPDYRSPLLIARSVYDEKGDVIADLMMGASVRYDPSISARKVEFLNNGDAHLWFPMHEKLLDLISKSTIKNCDVKFWHHYTEDGGVVCDEFPDLGMPVKRAPPFDMRAGGKPISIVVDFGKPQDAADQPQQDSKIKAALSGIKDAVLSIKQSDLVQAKAAKAKGMHMNKDATRFPAIPNAPAMPEAALPFVYSRLSTSRCYLEYGSGGSTVKASELGVPVIISVESDASWLDAVKQKVQASKAVGAQHHLVHIDIGPTKEWGFPTSDSGWRGYAKYPLEAWKLCKEKNLSPDLVLVDGRFRVACCLASFLFAKPGTRVLIDDYGDRPLYHAVEKFISVASTIDRVAEFIVPAELPRDEVWLALMTAVTDPR